MNIRQNVDRPRRATGLEPVARLRGPQLRASRSRGSRRSGPDEDARLAAVARDPAFREAVRGRAASRSRARSTSSRPARRAARRAGAAGRTSSPATGSATAPRTTRSGSSGRWPGARSRRRARRSRSARARWSASASCTSRRGRWRRVAPAPAAADGPVPRARARPRRTRPGWTGCRPRATRSRRRRATTSPPRSTGSTACSRRSPGRPAARADGDSGGGRTIAYLDCMRDLDVTLGPEVLDELRDVAAARCSTRRAGGAGACSTAARALLGQHRAATGPLAPQLGPLMGAGFGLWDQMGDEQRELQRRWADGRRVRRLDARLARLEPPLRRPPDRRGERRRDRARRLPRRARRLPRRRQPARPGPVRAPPPRPGGAAAADRRRRPAPASTSRRRAAASSR